MTAWSHLPNAAHIDRVIQSVKSHPESWNSARITAWSEARNAAYDAARDAILALVTYDDADKYLDMTPDQLKTWAVLSEEPAAVLLLPAVVAYEKISELELA